MQVEIDRKSGFCFGVINAIKKAEESLKGTGHLYCLGDIVHNGAEVERLVRLGLETISHDFYYSLKDCKVLIRAHGEPPEVYEHARKNNIELIDATCPVVLHLQSRVKSSHRQMEQVNGQTVIFGKPGHAEVVGINGQTGNKAIIVQNVDDLQAIDFSRPIALYSQTTRSIEEFQQVASAIEQKAGEGATIKIRDTICRQVANRGPHLKEFVKKFDIVIFVSGLKSSNGASLFNLCKSENPNTHMVTGTSDMQCDWFDGITSAGICGATSTPRWLMEEVATWIQQKCNHPK